MWLFRPDNLANISLQALDERQFHSLISVVTVKGNSGLIDQIFSVKNYQIAVYF